VVEFDHHLTGPHAIAEVDVNPAHDPVGFRRNRHFVDSHERADDLDRTTDSFLPDRFDLHRFGRLLAAARLSRLRLRTGCGDECGRHRDRQYGRERSGFRQPSNNRANHKYRHCLTVMTGT
jgi:hypothetical protein